MSRFARALSQVDARLAVPEPSRSRILLEISADMDDLFLEYLERGLGEAEAQAAVMEHFDLSEEVLRELVSVHDTPLQRSLETLSGQVRGPWSRLLMVLLALFVTVTSGSLLFRPQLYRDASGLVWVIMPFLAIGLAMAVIQLRAVFQTGDGWSPEIGRGLHRLLGLAALIVATAGAGLWVELYLSALRIRAVPGQTLVYLVSWLHMASATLVIALSGALVLGFLWFFLDSRARTRELTAAATLLGGIQ